MQRDFEHLPLLRQVYHEAPDDVFELIVSKCSDVYDHGWGWGGLNAFRLANKRLKRVVESCTTVLANRQYEDGPDSLPIPSIQRCGRIEKIVCYSSNLRSLEGRPDGLKRLWIGYATHLSNLSPLASCLMMKSLVIWDSSITDITVVSSMPLLGEFTCRKAAGGPSIKDLSPLFSCPRLKELDLCGNSELKDLSPLSACTDLESLDISSCPLITSLHPLSNQSNLKILGCSHCPLITSLDSLSTLLNLKTLDCYGIDPQTSLLPLASCIGLKQLRCSPYVVDLEELMRRRPQLEVTEVGEEAEEDNEDDTDGEEEDNEDDTDGEEEVDEGDQEEDE